MYSIVELVTRRPITSTTVSGVYVSNSTGYDVVSTFEAACQMALDQAKLRPTADFRVVQLVASAVADVIVNVVPDV